MPHANGRIYSETVNGVKVGINTDDVSAVLGVASHDVGTLCMSEESINPDALFVPRWTNKPGVDITKSNFTSAMGQTTPSPSDTDVTYIAQDYGIWVPRIRVDPMSFSIWYGRAKPWILLRPDAKSYKQLDHFDGYDHNVRSEKVIVDCTWSIGSQIVVTLRSPKPDGKTISISNLFGGKGWYFGVAVLSATRDTGFIDPPDVIKGSTVPISATAETQVTIQAGLKVVSTLDYMVIPFICNRSGVTDSTTADVTFFNTEIRRGYNSFIEINPNSGQVMYFRYYDSANIYPDGATPGTGSPIGNGNDYGYFSFAFKENIPAGSQWTGLWPGNYGGSKPCYHKIEIKVHWQKTFYDSNNNATIKSGTAVLSTDSTANPLTVVMKESSVILMHFTTKKLWEIMDSQGAQTSSRYPEITLIEGTFYYKNPDNPNQTWQFTMVAKNFDYSSIG